MKKLLLVITLICGLWTIDYGTARAQGPPPPPGTGVPIDTDVALLLIAAAAFGVWKLRR